MATLVGDMGVKRSKLTAEQLAERMRAIGHANRGRRVKAYRNRWGESLYEFEARVKSGDLYSEMLLRLAELETKYRKIYPNHRLAQRRAFIEVSKEYPPGEVPVVPVETKDAVVDPGADVVEGKMPDVSGMSDEELMGG